MNRTIINVVSGKGGTGKTLLACVLADMLGNAPDARALVIDLDVFVRGLTSLLYFHHEEKLQIAPAQQLTVSAYFIQKISLPTKYGQIAIAKYRSFDVVPAVSRIDERLNFQDIGPDTRDEATNILEFLISQVPAEYRFIILDSRAGYDELVSATHQLSDVSICVEEQDPISKLTADNLVAQLSQDSKVPVFRLVNKARGGLTPENIASEPRGVTDLGVIPFDMDIMNSFGSRDFWERVSRSLYRWALAQAWNRLSLKLDLGVELHSARLSPVASERLEMKIGFLDSKDRILFFYGLLIATVGLAYGLWGREFSALVREDPTRIIAIGMGIGGLAIALFPILRGTARRDYFSLESPNEKERKQ